METALMSTCQNTHALNLESLESHFSKIEVYRGISVQKTQCVGTRLNHFNA